ncbi:MAG: twin-arginine translocase subunit TatC [Alphaproteobacteria bacterium]|nr:twin-arginine translocase subunit TatC [Alphaproteobacteria bacterium]
MKWFKRKNSSKVEADMSFVDHLEALRKHIIRSVIAIVVVAISIFIYRDWVMDHIIAAPISPDFFSYRAFCKLSEWLHLGNTLCLPPLEISMQSTTFGGQFITSISLALIGGIIVAFPYIFWELWLFIKPGLTEKEIKSTRFIIFWVSFFFFSGALFGYFVLGPFTFNFLGNFKIGTKNMIVNIPTFTDYIENLTNLILGCGIAFELPVISVVLTKIGIITPRFLIKYRRHAIVIILVLAAFITPSPDWISQLIVFIPLMFLYELSIFLSKKYLPKDD